MWDDVVRVHAGDYARLIQERDELRDRLRAGEAAWDDGERRWEEKLLSVQGDLLSLRHRLYDAAGYDGVDRSILPLSDEYLLEKITNRLRRLAEVEAQPQPIRPLQGPVLPPDFERNMREAGRKMAESVRALSWKIGNAPTVAEGQTAARAMAEATAAAVDSGPPTESMPAVDRAPWQIGDVVEHHSDGAHFLAELTGGPDAGREWWDAVITQHYQYPENSGLAVRVSDASSDTWLKTQVGQARQPRVFTVDQAPPAGESMLLETGAGECIVWTGAGWHWDEDEERTPDHDYPSPWPPPVETGPWTEDVPPVEDTVARVMDDWQDLDVPGSPWEPTATVIEQVIDDD